MWTWSNSKYLSSRIVAIHASTQDLRVVDTARLPSAIHMKWQFPNTTQNQRLRTVVTAKIHGNWLPLSCYTRVAARGCGLWERRTPHELNSPVAAFKWRLFAVCVVCACESSPRGDLLCPRSQGWNKIGNFSRLEAPNSISGTEIRHVRFVLF